MVFGLPVVCTDTGGNLEAISDGENGFVVQVGDCEAMAGAITKIIENTNMRKKMRLNNREKVKKKFSYDTSIKSHEKLYAEMLITKRNISTTDDRRVRI